MGVEGFIEAGLYDPSAANAAERLQALLWLEAEGWPIDQLTGGPDDDLTGDLARYVVRPGTRLTAEEARAKTSLTVEEFDELSLASGFPTDGASPGYTEADARIFEIFHVARAFFTEAELLNFIRVVSTSLSRVTDAAVSLFASDIEAPIMQSGGSELEVGRQQLEAIGLLEQVVPVLETMMRLHMELSTDRRGEASGTGKSTMRMGVGFIDLVGFTPQSLDLDDNELSSLLMAFERTAHNTVTDGGGRVVKLIGDEVMFVAVDPAALCTIAQRLVQEYSRGGHVTPRGGLAYGEMLSRSGDYFGPIVNTASRIGDLAVPNELLVTPELAAAAPGFTFEPAGRRMLKGFPKPVRLLTLEGPQDL